MPLKAVLLSGKVVVKHLLSLFNTTKVSLKPFQRLAESRGRASGGVQGWNPCQGLGQRPKRLAAAAAVVVVVAATAAAAVVTAAAAQDDDEKNHPTTAIVTEKTIVTHNILPPLIDYIP